MLPADRYEALMNELDDLRIGAMAAERIATFDRSRAISHAEMMARFGGKNRLSNDLGCRCRSSGHRSVISPVYSESN